MRENPREKREPNNRCLNIDVKVNDPRQYLFLALWERDCFGFLCPKPTLPSFLLYIYYHTTTAAATMYGEPRKVQIIPSVLPADFGNLGAAVKRMEVAGCHRIQFDVMDGSFVPNLT